MSRYECRGKIRPYADNPTTEVEIQWYFAVPGAAPVPFPTAFGNQSLDRQYKKPHVGMTPYFELHKLLPFLPGSGKKVCGKKEKWRAGASQFESRCFCDQIGVQVTGREYQDGVVTASQPPPPVPQPCPCPTWPQEWIVDVPNLGGSNTQDCDSGRWDLCAHFGSARYVLEYTGCDEINHIQTWNLDIDLCTGVPVTLGLFLEQPFGFGPILAHLAFTHSGYGELETFYWYSLDFQCCKSNLMLPFQNEPTFVGQCFLDPVVPITIRPRGHCHDPLTPGREYQAGKPAFPPSHRVSGREYQVSGTTWSMDTQLLTRGRSHRGSGIFGQPMQQSAPGATVIQTGELGPHPGIFLGDGRVSTNRG